MSALSVHERGRFFRQVVNIISGQKLCITLPAWLVIGNLSEQAGFVLKTIDSLWRQGLHRFQGNRKRVSITHLMLHTLLGFYSSMPDVDALRCILLRMHRIHFEHLEV